MVLSLWDTIKDVANDAWKFINNNYDSYLFWVVIFAILLAVGLFTISKFANK